MFDPKTQIEAKPDTKAAKFKFEQNKTTDACVYVLKSYESVDASMLKPLASPILFQSPKPTVSATPPAPSTPPPAEEEEEEVDEEEEEEDEEDDEEDEEEEDTAEGFLNVVFKRDYMY
jgi:hypothetical protein